MNKNLSGKRVFAGENNVLKMRSSEFRVSAKSDNRCLSKKSRGSLETQANGSHVKTEAGSGAMQPQGKELLEPAQAERCKEGFSPGAKRGTKTLLTP